MRKPLVCLLAISLFALHCRKNLDSAQKDRFIVDKIYDNQDRLVGDYTYDANGRLLRTDFTDPVNNISSTVDYTYEKTRIKSIQFVSHTYSSSYQYLLFYNNDGRVKRSEAWKYGTRVGAINYEYDSRKRFVNVKNDKGEKNLFVSYDREGNVKQVKSNLIDPDNGVKSTQYANFTYDNHSKPDFGLGYVFLVDPLPLSGSVAMYERNISPHNITEDSQSGTKWTYTYNDQDLPATIVTKWQGMTEPMFLRIQYKKVP